MYHIDKKPDQVDLSLIQDWLGPFILGSCLLEKASLGISAEKIPPPLFQSPASHAPSLMSGQRQHPEVKSTRVPLLGAAAHKMESKVHFQINAMKSQWLLMGNWGTECMIHSISQPKCDT